MTSAKERGRDGGLCGNPLCRQAGWTGGWVWGTGGVLEGIVLLYYSKQLTVPVLGCRDREQPPGGNRES